jgi:hypothetical protein
MGSKNTKANDMNTSQDTFTTIYGVMFREFTSVGGLGKFTGATLSDVASELHTSNARAEGICKLEGLRIVRGKNDRGRVCRVVVLP